MIENVSGDPGAVRLKGRLTVEEVPEVYRQSLAWRDRELPRSVDLSGLEQSDSSAIALLLEWVGWARHAGVSIEFTAPPEGLRTIAGLSNVEPLLGWEKS